MPRFGFDATGVSADGKGIARVQRSAVAALGALGVDVIAFVRDRQAAGLVDVQAQVVRARPAILWEQLGLARASRRVDAVLTLTERLPLAGGGRFVVWLFEVPTHRIAENRRRGAGPYQRGSDLVTLALWKRSLRRASRVVTGSRATARDVEQAVPELAGRVEVAYPGLGEGFSPGAGRPGVYLFHLASPDPRDNTETVLTAYDVLRRRVGDAPPLLVGGALGGRDTDLRRAAREGVEFLGRVSDEELVRLYRGAAAYVDATLYEGFGYQVLESMACGTPVVASRASSIPEVVGDAGLLCDPRSPDEIAGALGRVLADHALAAELRRRGLARAERFSWERTARQLAAVLTTVSE